MLTQPNPGTYAAMPNERTDFPTLRTEPFEAAHISALDIVAGLVAAMMILGPMAMAWRSTVTMMVI